MNTRERIIKLVEDIFPSYAAFERELGLQPQKVNDWKLERSKSYNKMIPQIAQALNTTSAYLLCEIDDPSPNSNPATPEGEQPELTERQLMKQELMGLIENMDENALKAVISLLDAIENKPPK